MKTLVLVAAAIVVISVNMFAQPYPNGNNEILYDRGGDIDKGVARDISKSSVFIASYINDEFNRNWNAKDDDGQ